MLLMIFSTANTTPSLHLMPIDVPPFSTALTAYSALKETRQLKVDGSFATFDSFWEAHLEIPAVGREDGVLEVIACAD